ncbi:laminin B domain-containing protein [Roseateles sp. DC23W]|uniref:Laminin B domain-containing protein n=1 Tax=Pelomonas dachongensis TaxID=3299029 RepID=A0ABW7EH62_9BURK
MTRSLRAFLTATCLTLPLAAPAASFDDGDEGWTTPDGVQTWFAVGGNAGGWLRVEDVDGSTDILLTAPSGWLGNWSSFLGGTLSFDVKKDNNVSSDWSGFGEIRISGPGGSVILDAAAPNLPADNLWTHYSVALTPTAGWNGASLAAVLANVTSLTINGEFHAGPGEVVGFDNIQVTAVPEPASAALLAGGLALLAGLRRKR